MSERPGFEIPALVEFPPDTKAMVISALKLVLRRMHEAGLLAREISYGDLLGTPQALYDVIRLYKEHREIARDIAVDARGEPVGHDRAELVCGITLAQVERLLVFTCAKRVFAAAGHAWQGAVRPGTLVPDEVKRILAFDWQLPLLELYRDSMTVEHFRVLGDAVLTLRTPDSVITVASLNPVDLARLKATVDSDLGLLFASETTAPGAPPAAEEAPAAAEDPVPAAAATTFSSGTADGRIEGEIVDEPAMPGPMAAEPESAPASGMPAEPAATPEPAAPPEPGAAPDPVAEPQAFTATPEAPVPAAADPLEDLRPSIREPLLSGFRASFGDDSERILGDPGFVAEILPGVVAQARRHAESDERGIEEWALREWFQLKPRILLWMRVRTGR